MSNRAEWLVNKLGLQPHPEGGCYRETYRAPLTVFSSQVRAERNAMTHIYYLLTREQVSRLHRVAHDELWFYHEGAELILHRIDQTIEIYDTFRLGSIPESPPQLRPQKKTTSNQTGPVVIIPASCWQAAESTGAYTLVSCIVAPGFDFHDFTMLYKYKEEKEKISKFWPGLVRLI
jgi:predicted cupin superfamily sugar epimerase